MVKRFKAGDRVAVMIGERPLLAGAISDGTRVGSFMGVCAEYIIVPKRRSCPM